VINDLQNDNQLAGIILDVRYMFYEHLMYDKLLLQNLAGVDRSTCDDTDVLNLRRIDFSSTASSHASFQQVQQRLHEASSGMIRR
jgi:hypothetical protein